jgi:ferrous-iron efflux pump FieF
VLDVAASAANMFAVRFALKPADEDHRFGHGKAEPLAAVVQSVFVSLSGLFLAYESVRRLVSPVEVTNTTVGLIIMAGSLALTCALLAFQRYVIKRTNSLAIRADSIHYASDISVNIVVLCALAIVKLTGFDRVDGICSVLISIYILYSAFQIATEGVHSLMDRELPDATREEVERAIKACPQVCALRDLRTRGVGMHVFVSVVVELAPHMTLREADEVAADIEHAIRPRFATCEIFIRTTAGGKPQPRQAQSSSSPPAPPAAAPPQAAVAPLEVAMGEV